MKRGWENEETGTGMGRGGGDGDGEMEGDGEIFARGDLLVENEIKTEKKKSAHILREIYKRESKQRMT